MNTKIIQWVLPLLGLSVLVAVAILTPFEAGSSGWIPLVGGFGNTEMLDNVYLSVGLMLLCVTAIVVALCSILFKTNTIPMGVTVMLFLLLLFSNPYSFMFSSIYPALLCIVLMQYALLSEQMFAGALFISLASLFYAPLIWLFPVVFIFMVKNGINDPARIAVKMFSGFLVPHIYVLVFRWIAFDDALVYLQHFSSEIIDVGLPFHLLHLTDYFLILVVMYMLVRAISFVFSKTPDGIPAYILKSECATLLLLFMIWMLFYDSQRMPLLNMLWLPVSVILAYYYKNCRKRARVTAEFLLLFVAVIISSLSNVLN